MIVISRDFSKVPAGRYPSHGPNNGQRFRHEILIPQLKAAESVSVDLDGIEGVGSSFLEEAFGGLVREGFAPAELRKRLVIKSEEDPTLIQEIFSYIDDEGKRDRS